MTLTCPEIKYFFDSEWGKTVNSTSSLGDPGAGTVVSVSVCVCDASADWAQFEELVSGARDDYQMEKRYLRKDGKLIWRAP